MRIAARLLALALIGGLVALMLRPGVPMPAGQWDKAAHAAAFFMITLALHPGLGIAADRGGRVRTALLAVAMGAAVEMIQPLVGRNREALDLLADAVGTGVAWAVGARVLKPLMRWVRRETQT